jgi:ribosome biogenesis GTPase
LAANIDVVFIVTAPDGDFNPARIERLLALVHDSGAVPVVILNKADLTVDALRMTDQISAISSGVPVHVISARARDGLGAIEGYFYGNRSIGLIGSSGVGKSTLTNELLGREAQVTQAVRAHDSRGRHTTTHRQLFLRPGGGCLIDTPGMRGVERWIAVGVDDDEEGAKSQLLELATDDKTERKRRRLRRMHH